MTNCLYVVNICDWIKQKYTRHDIYAINKSISDKNWVKQNYCVTYMSRRLHINIYDKNWVKQKSIMTFTCDYNHSKEAYVDELVLWLRCPTIAASTIQTFSQASYHRKQFGGHRILQKVIHWSMMMYKSVSKSIVHVQQTLSSSELLTCLLN